MRTCDDKWNNALMDVALGVKSPEVDRHVRDCASCAGALSSLRADASALDEAVGVLSNAKPSPSFRAQVLAGIPDAPDRPLQLWPWFGAASAVLVGIAVMVAIIVTTTPPDREYVPDPEIANWRSPTAELLYSASYKQLQQVPRLGGFHVDLPETLYEENNDEEHDDS